jgi:hypothetical protein
MKVVGVDGCNQGWVAVALAGGAFADARIAGTFAEVLAAFPDATIIAVDIPIGWPRSLLPRGAEAPNPGAPMCSWRVQDTRGKSPQPSSPSRSPSRRAWLTLTRAGARQFLYFLTLAYQPFTSPSSDSMSPTVGGT